MPDTAHSNAKSRLELTVDLVRALAWPTLVAFMLASFWEPLQQTVRQVPSIVARSDSIVIAGISLRVAKDLKAKATPEVLQALTRLSPNSIEQILQTGHAAIVGSTLPLDRARSEVSELRDLGILEELSAGEVLAQSQNKLYGQTANYYVKLTPFGRQVKTFLSLVVREFVREVAIAAQTEERGGK